MQKTKKINFSEIGIKQHKKKMKKIFFEKMQKNTPPDPPLFIWYFMEFYKISQKLLPLAQFLVHIDEHGIKMLENLFTLYIVNFFFSTNC